MDNSGGYWVSDRPYVRRFRQPLKTAHGLWSEREGIVVELRSRTLATKNLTSKNLAETLTATTATGCGQGEIAPLPWFGSETQAEALAFCRSLAGVIDDRAIDGIPETLPACQFAFESAREQLRSTAIASDRVLECCQLLPAGRASLAALAASVSQPQPHLHTGSQTPPTFKWKIATEAIERELETFQALLDRLPAGAQLRLDANGGLSVDRAGEWLAACDRANRHAPCVEFLEQPLPPDRWADLMHLSASFATPLALDESIASLHQLITAREKGWRGLYVIKPAIIGSPRRLRSICTQFRLDTVFSSVFETAIGREAGLRLARELQTRDRAVGYGLDRWLLA